MRRMSANLSWISLSALVAGTMLIASCSSTPKKTDTGPATTTTESSGAGTSGLSSGGVGAGQQLSPEQLARQELEKVGYIVYFDYDKSDVKSDYASLIAAHAKYLAANPSRKVRLEGNTDERGSREYNIGLGERRAQAVRQALMLQGVSDSQITTLSYGEERPAVDGHDEAAYAKNRRVELAY